MSEADHIKVSVNRASRKWTRWEQVGRVLWAVASPLFRLSPRPLWGWRNILLHLFGARIGAHVHVYPTVRVLIPWNLEIGDGAAVGDHATIYALGPITIGPRATVSQGSHLCAGTHDISSVERTLLKPPITIGHDAWICADAFIGPGVEVGEGAIVGARAVVMKHVPPMAIVAGNPAKLIRMRTHDSI